MALRLQQGQVWQRGDEFIRIVRLDRLQVDYKVVKHAKFGEGTHHQATKKDFCRLIKSATLLAPDAPAKSSPPASE